MNEHVERVLDSAEQVSRERIAAGADGSLFKTPPNLLEAIDALHFALIDMHRFARVA